MMTKYNFIIPQEVIAMDRKRLINQLWKILPMRENEEEWEKQLQTVIYEIVGLNEVFSQKVNFLVLLSKLESLFKIDAFQDFRKTIFESIGLLDDLLK